MGNGNFVGQRARINSTVPLDLPVWRRDGRDIKAMKNILEQQVKRLTLDYPQISEDKLVECMQIYSDGVWDAYRGMVELILEEQIPYVSTFLAVLFIFAPIIFQFHRMNVSVQILIIGLRLISLMLCYLLI